VAGIWHSFLLLDSNRRVRQVILGGTAAGETAGNTEKTKILPNGFTPVRGMVPVYIGVAIYPHEDEKIPGYSLACFCPPKGYILKAEGEVVIQELRRGQWDG
jgi:hypothetical protein